MNSEEAALGDTSHALTRRRRGIYIAYDAARKKGTLTIGRASASGMKSRNWRRNGAVNANIRIMAIKL